MGNIFVKIVGEMDLRKDAWVMSRPYLKEDDIPKINWNEVLTMDMSLQSMYSICFHIKSSMAFRELLSTLRDHSMWARTSRVTPIESMEIPEYLKDGMLKNQYYQFIDELIELSKIPISSQDSTRLQLRMCTLTEYYIMLDIRSWIKFLKYLYKFQSEYFNIYGIILLEKLNLSLNEFHELNYTPSIDHNLESITQTVDIKPVGNYYFISAEIPFSLRAQLVRHRYIQILDELPLMNFYDLEAKKLCDREYVNLIMSKSHYAELARKRSCWIAHFNLYCELLEPWYKHNNLFNTIPCRANHEKCEYKGDMLGRIIGKDPGLVCPFWIDNKCDQINKINQYIELFGSNSMILRYKDVIESLNCLD